MRRLVVLCCVTLCAMFSGAQDAEGIWQTLQTNADMARRMGYQPYRVDSTQTKTLGIELEALAFFKDNEFDGNVQRGYSLPGVRLQPRLTYTPIDEIKLELGLHATIYSGANKYPCYVFHDIATWKGDQYQSGAHLLPFFRATARFKSITLAVGDIYGGATHGFVEPMYNPELILTDDPEMGFQMIVDTKRWHSDLWMNWQSYIFKESSHQEAFTVGWTQNINVWKRTKEDRTHSLDIPIQLVIQHRGGEQDNTKMGVQTIANGALGMGYEYKAPGNRIVTGVQAEVMALYCLQQSGNLWPFKNGPALWLKASVDFIRDLRVTAGFFSAKDFCSLYGSQYFGTLSTKRAGGRFDGMNTGLISLEYSRTFANAYTIGANLKAYIYKTGSLALPADDTHPEPYTIPGEFRTPFSFGVYFRCSPSFVLKRFGSAKDK
ncbi:MAG: hypothetical protein J6R11_02785 [Bacteroidaceae bacterium]|nr:hypothetical protein [Bacteroidaceae bacterium]